MRTTLMLALALLSVGCKGAEQPPTTTANSQDDANAPGPGPDAKAYTPEQVCDRIFALRPNPLAPGPEADEQRESCIARFRELSDASNWDDISSCGVEARTSNELLRCGRIVANHDPPGVDDDDALRRACNRITELRNARSEQLAGKRFPMNPNVMRAGSNGCIEDMLEQRSKYSPFNFAAMLECMAVASSNEEISECERQAK
jgi:hypothetical protein